MICPVCRKETINGMAIDFVEKLNWVRCSCGVVFQEEMKEKEVSTEYLTSYKEKKFYEKSAKYPVNVYFGLIEEMIFGRKLLEIDSLDFEVSKEAAQRGWVTYATGQGECEGVHVIDTPFKDIEKVEDKFDCIFTYHQIEKNPEIIKKFHDWLVPGGVLFIATPDAQYIDELGVTQFGHWFGENQLFYSKPMLTLELEKNGFIVELIRANNSSRFIKSNDMHIIARRTM